MLALTTLTMLALVIGACGGGGPTPVPTTAPTPIVTPDPHLGDPATAQEVFNGLGRAGVRITPNTATAGPKDGDMVTKIFATYLGWPVIVTEFRSSAALAKVLSWEPGEDPGRGEHPIALAGSNILVTWGPAVSGAKPGRPDARQADGLKELVAALDVLLSPLRARTNVAVSISTPVATAPTAPVASPEPEATPAP
ncbi:MAG: hypothetical protein ACRDIL_00640 [Candidatus Limnocylindrales bacterium]